VSAPRWHSLTFLGFCLRATQVALSFASPHAIGSHASSLAAEGILNPTSRLDAGALGHGMCKRHNGSVTITVTTMADNDDN
jgi:hypothetical protein